MRTITVQCSPDADDLFMMRALLEGQLDTGDLRYEIATSPTDDLNRLASGGGPDVCAISTAHYPKVAERYQMLPHGGSMGEGYGPILIAPQKVPVASLTGRRVAIPGLTTSAWATLRLVVDVEPVVVPIAPYARTFEVLRSGEVEAALIIHEGRLTYEAEGFVQLLDIGEWWHDETGGLPLPLGSNTIRRDLGPELIARVSAHLYESIRLALADRDASIAWLMARGSALPTPEKVSEYLDMYANGRTLDYGPLGRDAIDIFLWRLAEASSGPRLYVDYAP